MSDEDKDDPNLVFHYTSKEGYEGIKKEGKINRSVKSDDDVTYGINKTYLTSRDPAKNTPLEIAKSNYDGSPQYAESKLPSTKVAIGFDRKEIKATVEDPARKILTVKGDIDLSKAKVVYTLQKDGSYKKDEGN